MDELPILYLVSSNCIFKFIQSFFVVPYVTLYLSVCTLSCLLVIAYLDLFNHIFVVFIMRHYIFSSF